MEHRQCPRMPADVEVLIYRKGVPVVSGRIRNLSHQGMFISATAGGALHRNDYVELAVKAPAVDATPGHQRIPALIMHEQAHGVGVAIDPIDPVASQVLQQLLQAEPRIAD